MSQMDLKPMSIGGILDTAFRLYSSNFITFLIIGLVAYVPYSVLVFVMQTSTGMNNPAAEPGGPGSEVETIGAIVGGIGTIVFALVVLPLCSAAMVQKISSTYLGEQMSAMEAYKKALSKIVKLLIANILMGMIVMVGFILCVVPGIIFGLWFALVTSVVILEPVGPIDALKRSKALMKDNLSKGFALGLLVGVLTIIVSLAIGMGIGVFAGTEQLEFLVGTFGESIIQALILPFSTGVFVLLYYDMRIRKEAFDLEQLARDFAGESV